MPRVVLDTNVVVSGLLKPGGKDDPSDNKFLACALEAKADFFIMGNIKHFPFKKFHKTRIVTQAEFLDIIAETLFA